MNEATRRLITDLLPIAEKHNALVIAEDGEVALCFASLPDRDYGHYFEYKTAEECREFLDMDQAEKMWFS